MSSCIASHLPPLEVDGGGAAASLEYCLDLGNHFLWQRVKEGDGRRRPHRIILDVALEEVDEPGSGTRAPES